MSEKRIKWIDICKGIGIFFVVLSHVMVSKTTDIWIHSFNMPFFFLLSGLCFDEKKNNKLFLFLKKRFKTLIIP